jgi:hypothetical protein
MSDAGFVITGWVVTTLAVAGYWGQLVWRTRAASRSR